MPATTCSSRASGGTSESPWRSPSPCFGSAGRSTGGLMANTPPFRSLGLGASSPARDWRKTPSDSSWGRIVNADPGLCCGPVNSVRQGVDVRCVLRRSPRRWEGHIFCVTGGQMSSTGSVGGGERIVILYSFPHALGAPGIGWTAWNQVNELVRAGHRVHLVTASVASPVAGLASLDTSLTLAGRRIPHRALGGDRALAWHDRVTARRVVRRQPDVVHVWPLAGVRTIAAAARLG